MGKTRTKLRETRKRQAIGKGERERKGVAKRNKRARRTKMTKTEERREKAGRTEEETDLQVQYLLNATVKLSS